MLHLQHGGVEKQTISLINHLNGYEIEVICFYKFDGIPAYPLNSNIKVKYLYDGEPNRNEFKNAISSLNPLRILKEGLKSIKILHSKKRLMIREIKDLDSDIVFSTRCEYADLISQFAPSNIKKITQEHNHFDNPEYGQKVKKYFKNIDVLIVMSEIAASLYRDWLSELSIDIVIIPNMLDEINHESSSLDHSQVVAAGRFHPVKDFLTLIDMMKCLHKLDGNIKLCLIGDGEQKKLIQERITLYHLEDVVKLTGMISSNSVQKYFLESDLFIMTSIHECFPMVILEANACGLPVISFDIDAGPKMIIQEDKNGNLIKNRDVNQMAERIHDLYQERATLLKMGKNAKAISNDYLPEKIIPMWIKVFEA